ncbi:MAG: TlpA family protein disulfide reductase [Myxococcales bacterium]|nr:TlpA family protein disulfide reductase [Myxococcales bacterium]
MRLICLLLCSLMALPACDSGGGDDSESGPREGYPTAGFGTTEGSILANLEFTTPDGGTYDFAGIYADGHNRVLMVVTASGWCTACREEQPKLQALHEEYGDAGLALMVAVFQKNDYSPADAAFAAQWKRQYDLTFPVVADDNEPFLLSAYYDESLTPMIMLVEVDTMKILSIDTGFDESAVRAILEAKL